ncbi:single-stranded-DNA-specific exonuclease RecJ [Niveibacterium sp. 24ML]|nr:single-stranded-DNA-specific exonuclease RecJ [Niveibacterium sp. 24ML]MCX9158339.1 single-stranded-DNA-specific exonuclease RecJ [Niveibacterium sp. 24ML]
MQLTQRPCPAKSVSRLNDAGLPPLLARLYSARGVERKEELDYALSALLPPEGLRGIQEAAVLLADTLAAQAPMLIVADYDCDGATACAVGIRALRAFGGTVDYLVPNRFKFGYGLTPAIVALAAERKPALLITVDNGIASVEGVAAARAAGITTLITDHHLPGDTLPDADVIVNPNQPGCSFASKHIAGVGVMFYTMLALRAELRKRDWFASRPEPKLADLLDLVALGTVADVVKLDQNNRILVHQGLARMRAGKMQPGVRALFAAASRDPMKASTFDLGFGLGPRLNAAGRLADMSLGIECLITDEATRALNLARELDRMNQERRSIEEDMQATAALMLESLGDNTANGVALFDPDWHQGVVGIVAGRVKERLHRPVIAFARSDNGQIKGSGRSVAGVHLRDVLDLLSKRVPDLILTFGGHSMAAGVLIREADFERFAAGFDAAVQALADEGALNPSLETDGSLAAHEMSLEAAQLIEREIWGQGFPAPLFADTFEVESQRLLKDAHVKLTLKRGSERYEAIRFRHADPAPDTLRAAFRLASNEYKGVASLQLLIEHWEAA